MIKPLLTTICFLSCPAFGAWTLVDNFESSNSLNNWTLIGTGTSGRTITVATNSEAGVTGNALRIYSGTTATDMFAFRNLPESIPNESTAATLYFRMFVGAASSSRNAVGGLAETPIGNYANYASVARLSGNNFDVYHGNGAGAAATSFGGYQAADTSAQTGVWYDVWMVINNAADTYQVYYSENGGTQTLASHGGGSTYTLRQGGAEAINGFMAATSSPAGTISYFDDIYLDTSGENLFIPVAVPEPATTSLGAIAASFGLLRRRRD